jgi:hypothetical protein
LVSRGGIFLGEWGSFFAGNSDGKMNVQSACALNTRYKTFYILSMYKNSQLHAARFCPLRLGVITRVCCTFARELYRRLEVCVNGEPPRAVASFLRIWKIPPIPG